MMYIVPDLAGGCFERQEAICRNVLFLKHHCLLFDVIESGDAIG
jgi:hypothetical protein